MATSTGPMEFDISTHQFKNHKLNFDSHKEDIGITTFFKDKSGNFWFGHDNQHGLSMLCSKLNAIKKIEFPKQKFSPDFYGSVASEIYFSKRYKRYFLVNTNHDGLLEYSSDFKLLKQTTLPDNWKNKEPFIIKLAEDSEGKVWIVDITHKLIQYEPTTGTARNTDPGIFNACYNVVADESGALYFVTDKGIYRYFQKKWILVVSTDQDLILSNVTKDKLYFIADRKVKLLHLQTFHISLITELPKFSTQNYNYIQSLYCDSKNRLWIPLELGGVYVFNQADSKLSFLSGMQGLASNTAREIIEDDNGRIFILCQGGLFHFDEKQQRCIDFDNLISKKTNDWYEHFIYVTPLNQLLLSKDDCIFLIDQSAALHFESSEPAVTCVIGRGFSFFNIHRYITIPHHESGIKVTFSNFDFAAVNEITYEYILDKGNWIQLEKGKNTLDLQNLSEGAHVFKYRIAGSNAYSVLNFTISAVWYKSKVFYFLLFLFITFAFVAGIWYWQNRKYKEQVLLKTLSEYKLKVLQSQLNPHFLFNCLNSINALIKIGDYERAQHTLQGFSKLMRNLLSVSDEQLISIQKELEMAVSYLEIEKLRKDYLFDYKIDSSLKDETLTMVPPLLLQPFLENCIKHGFGKLASERKFEIKINIYQTEGGLEIEILDNGNGLNPEKNTGHISRGVQIQRERLSQYSLTNHMKIDLVTGSNLPHGYRVLIKIVN